MYFRNPAFSDVDMQHEERTYQWYSKEHCVVQGGYNQASNLVTVYDPLQGTVEVDANHY